MKRLMVLMALGGIAAGVAETGVWTLERTADGYSSFATASSWMNAYVPTQAHDSVVFTAVSPNTNDRAWIWGDSAAGAIFGNVKLPATDKELVLDALAGYRQYRLTSSGADADMYSFLDVSGYLGSLQLQKHARLRIRAGESGRTQELHKLVVSGAPGLDVDGGVVELGGLTGVGTLNKTGSGELRLSGVTAANGVHVRVAEGVLTLNGVPDAPEPVAGAAAHFDFSDAATLTLSVSGRVSRVTDVRGGPEAGYRTLAPTFGGDGNHVRRVAYGDLQLLDFGVPDTDYCKSLVCDAKIPGVKTLFVVYRHNVQDFNGVPAFPVNSETGYELRRPQVLNEARNDRDGCCALLWDFSATNLFMYQQYGYDYQSFAPQAIVTGDIRRNGESVVYNATPRSFRDELEVLSINLNTNGLTAGAIADWNFKYVARAQNNGYDGGCQVGEILLYTNALTDAEQKRNIDYLTAKWGRAESRCPWLAGGVGGAQGAEVNVPAGETAYVKTLDTRSGALVKTGAGTLVARHVAGAGGIRVKEGQVAFVGGRAQTEAGAGSFQPAPGMVAHFDASDPSGMTFDADGRGVLRWDSSVTNHYSAKHNDYLAVTNKTGPALTGMVPFRTEADRRSWVDFGEIAVTSKDAATPNSGWMRVGRPDQETDNGNSHVREIFWVWKTRPAADGTNPVLIGGGGNDWWRYCRPGKGVMINAASVYSDNNRFSSEAVLQAQWAVDGRVVDPTRENYPEDVHVVRVSLPTSLYFCGVGNDDFYVRGGFQLGELITYYRELTDRERVDTETYLLRKWTGKDHPEFAGAAPSAAAVAYDVKPASLSAAEGLTVQATRFPADEAAPAFLTDETAFIHLDASDPSTMAYTAGADGVLSVSSIADPRGNGRYAAPSFAHKPRLRMNHLNGLSVLDLGQKGDANSAATDSADLKFSAGTGSGQSMLIVYANQPGSDAYANVVGTYQWWGKNWNSGGADAFFSADSSLDPQATEATVFIDGTRKGAGAETGTQVPSGFHVVAFNNGRGWGNMYAGLASLNAGSSACGGMLLCEAWAFTRTLTAAEIAAATSYLQKKWGLAGQTFAAPAFASLAAAKDGAVKLGMAVTATALSGAGTISAPSVGGVAEIDATLRADGVDGPNLTGALELAETGVVRLTAAFGGRKVAVGTYPVVTGATFAAGTAEKVAAGWSLDAPALPGLTAALRFVDGQLCVSVIPDGLILLVK